MKDLPYRTFLFPIPSLFACVLCILIILGQGMSATHAPCMKDKAHHLTGYTAFTPHFDGVLFATNYIGIVPVVVAYIGYKLIRRTRVISLDDIGESYLVSDIIILTTSYQILIQAVSHKLILLRKTSVKRICHGSEKLSIS